MNLITKRVIRARLKQSIGQISQQDHDVYQYTAGDGGLTILDDAPQAYIKRLEINGYHSSDAIFRRLSAGSEDYLIQLRGTNDNIVIIGEQPQVNGVNQIYFVDDMVTLDNPAISALLDVST